MANDNKKSFATNWFNNVDDISQLLISDFIWNKEDYDSTNQMSIERVLDSPTKGRFVIDGKTIMGFECDFSKSKWILLCN